MTKVTLHPEGEKPEPTPAKSANQLTYMTDAKGRKIGLRQPPFLEQFRILQTVGPQLSANQAYMGMLNPLLFIAEIDGDPVGIPRTQIQVDELIQRAGEEGFIAASLGIKQHFSTTNPALQEQIKNLVGTLDS
jgi:hypothetical protein